MWGVFSLLVYIVYGCLVVPGTATQPQPISELWPWPPLTTTAQSTSTTAKPESKIWALLVAGSNGYSNYRHQADICHAYQILRRNGIPDENIIVMMYDDIAYSQDNPTPGIIVNQPGGPNVYQGVPKDYTGDSVTSEHFLHVLSGNKSAVAGIGTSRVIESGPGDVIFVNFVDHGGPGVIYFPNDELLADSLVKTISRMNANRKFSKFILYVEACHAGSMFDDILPDTTNVFVLAAADPFESSYACYYDDTRNTYLGDVFSVMWMNDTEHESLPEESIHHQFERVRSATNTSHVEEYGDLDIGSTKLKDIIGFRMRDHHASYRAMASPNPYMDTADNMDVPFIILDKRIKKEKDPIRRKELKIQKHTLMKKRSLVDDIYKEIITKVADYNTLRMNELRTAQYGLNWNNFPCYKMLMTTVNKLCVNAVKSPYARIHFQKLINICSVSWVTKEKAVETIAEVCETTSTPLKYFSVI